MYYEPILFVIYLLLYTYLFSYAFSFRIKWIIYVIQSLGAMILMFFIRITTFTATAWTLTYPLQFSKFNNSK